MTPALAQAPAAVRWVLPAALVLVIGALPMTWIHVASLGGFDLKVPYALAIAFGLILWLFPSALAVGLRHLPTSIAPWLLVYVFYLVVLSFGLAGGSGQGIVLRQVFFLSCGFIVALGIVATSGDGRVLRRSGMVAIAGFLVVTEFLAQQIGLGWAVVVKHFVSTGDLDFVFYHFLRELFQLVAAGGSEAKASDKNVVAVAILIAVLLMRAGYQGLGNDRFGRLITLLALFVLVILNTRSVLIMAALGLPLAAWVGTLRSGVSSTHEFIFKSAFYFGIMVAGFLLVSMDAGTVGLIGDRLSFSDDSSGKRVQQYAWALERIEAHPWFGSGMAEFKGQPVHNLFLGAWMHAGILAFALVIISYLIVVVGWIVFLLRIAIQPNYWVLPTRPEWIAILPTLPLFRVWIAGDAGHPSFVEWMALFIFFAMIQANRLARTGQ